MFTYQINVEYLGTNFVGWQIQKNGTSVQGVLEKVLSNFLKYKIKVIGSGRTDSGVHANEQSAHFKTKDKIKDKNGKILRMTHDQVMSENSQAYIMQGISRDINDNQNKTELRNSTDS